MIKSSLSRLVVGLGALAFSLTAGAGVASADPDLGPAVNSTCTYSQFVTALNAQDPQAAAAFDASPPTQASLRQFLAAPPNQRVRMAQMMQSAPGAQQYLGLIQQVFSVCSNY